MGTTSGVYIINELISNDNNVCLINMNRILSVKN